MEQLTMPFDEVQYATQRSRVAPNTVRVGLYGGGELAVRISKDVYTRLGWDMNTTIGIHEGRGADALMIQLAPNDASKGGYRPHFDDKDRADAVMVLRVPVIRLRHHLFPSESQPSLPTTFQAFGSALTIILPKWAQTRIENTTNHSEG